jgi:hypothetical protein
LIEPGRGVYVDGDEVEIDRFCWFIVAWVAVAALAGTCLVTGVECLSGEAGELTCVWMRVLTTSRGHVMTPANPPAAAPVASSRGNPISLLPFHWRDHVWHCS